MTGCSEEVYALLADQILSRYRRSKGKSMLDVYRVDPGFLDVDSDFLEYVITNREGIIAVLIDPVRRAGLVDLFVEEALRYIYANNQFINMDETDKAVFTRIYADYLTDIQEVIETSPDVDRLGEALHRLLGDHFQRLSTNIARYFDSRLSGRVQENLILKKAVCSEYSAEFQLKIMGVDTSMLMEPLLDIGCGKAGDLVKYLRSRGIDARGADRVVDGNEILTACDWFDLPLDPGTWGTILSHMSFSNHFNFHHRYRNGRPENYARLYLKILRALKPGGAFIYTPGLPFIERFLSSGEYRVRRSRLRLARLEELHAVGSLNEDFWYVTRVTRL